MIQWRILDSLQLHPGQDPLVLNGPQAGLTAAKASVGALPVSAWASPVPERADPASLVVLTEAPAAA